MSSRKYESVTGKESFESLFDKYNKYKNISPKQSSSSLYKPPITKAEKGATLPDFINMVAEIVSKTLKKHNAIFIPDEGGIIKDPHATLEHPTILYKVVERKPVFELKPRPTEEIIENEHDEISRRFGMIYSQRQACTLQFDIVASDYLDANAVMNTFEEAMFTYTGYFKSKGVFEMYFERHLTDKNLDNYRQDLSVRSLQYHVEILKLITVFDSTIDDITVNSEL